MSTNNIFTSDLYKIHNVIQSSMLVYQKEAIIATLRDFFSKDSYYHYSRDAFGFPNTTDHTDLPLGADIPSGAYSHPELNNLSNISTRIFIGENFRYNSIYYPAILVKSGGAKYVPISINRDKGGIKYENIIYVDPYGNEKVVSKPSYFITAGAWEGSLSIDVVTRSLRARDDLVELIAMCFTEINFDTLVDVGIIIKPLSIGQPSESNDRNDKLFRQSITLDIRTEWRREIPIYNIVDAILFTVSFSNLSKNNIESKNLEIITENTITDAILNI